MSHATWIDPEEKPNAQPRTLYGHTKFETLKSWHVVVHGDPDPQELLNHLWSAFGYHPARIAAGSKTVVAGEVRGDALHLVVNYTVRGGYPSDLKRWISRIAKIDRDCITAKQIGDTVVTNWE